ncbi:PDZ domain-containing protein [Bacillus solimangrovi]|uniref:PDZ domain-containing protein n=1 Tax=Bacillus solimangrovi TaxID=1305675 RepID=A0A1E5LDQ8_9BACI|nr:PDZ domain-containing protein [Bacillus solimangrovi]OEH92217.1 hypothetical protein BFG57_02810 [Bacillus solimangrovi]
MELWLDELLKGFGKFFLHPFLYAAIIVALLLGVKRVKRERKDFHVRVYDSVLELGELFLPGVVVGLIVSFGTIMLGITIPIGFLTVVAALYILLSLTLQIRWVSPAYVISFAVIFVFFMKEMELGWGSVLDVSIVSFTHLIILLSILVLVEAVLLMRFGGKRTSPMLLKGKRGKLIGAHQSNKLWLIPLFLLVPVESGIIAKDWWPLLPEVNGQSYMLMLVPFASGVTQRIRTELPQIGMKRIGKQVLLLALLLCSLSIASLWLPYLILVTCAVAIIGREWIYYRQKHREDRYSNLFTEHPDGLIITGIIPKSPAEKFDLKVGERINKVNKRVVRSEKDFYEALQLNRAFCKMEVVDMNGEIRFAQGAVYEGEHHELGLLFLPVIEEKISSVEQM